MKVLVTGANGFVGRNLCAHLAERGGIEVVPFTRESSVGNLPELIRSVDFIFHLAGVNRPEKPEEFKIGNSELTYALCEAVGPMDEPYHFFILHPFRLRWIMSTV